MKTYQDLLEVGQDEKKRMEFILSAINIHKQSESCQTALTAEQYDKKQNTTITRYQKLLYTVTGQAIPDYFSANHKTVNGFFPAFVTQQSQYLLGNGLTLSEETNKERLGTDFDTRLQQLGRLSLVEGVAFGFWNLDHLEVFKLTEFVPLYDEETGALRAGIRFWQVDAGKPLRATLYEEDGYTDYIKRQGEDMSPLRDRKTSYRQVVRQSGIDGTQILDGENYPGFPIIPLWGNPHHQSELVGIRQSIDCYDFVKSGFANDIDEASMIYWTLENAGGMDDIDLARFLQRMKTIGAAVVDGDAGAKAEAHTIDVPYQAREAMLDRIKADLYLDFQVVNVQELSAGAKTATEIRAAYQPMDNKVDQFEYCVLDFLSALFAIVGIEDTPTFTRSRIVNQLEETQMVLMAAQYLDDETLLGKLPWLTQEEITGLLERKDAEDLFRFGITEEPSLEV